MTVVIVGASRGLGRALATGLARAGHEVIGVARTLPPESRGWIAADLSKPAEAAALIGAGVPQSVDTVIWNVGVWEAAAFSPEYDFAAAGAAATAEIETLVATNVTAAILGLRALLPTLTAHARPRVILTGSTSGLRGSGRPEVAFGASKHALTGIAEALREGYRGDGLAVTTLQLGNLNTEDGLEVPEREAAARGAGTLIPVHDVVRIVVALLELSPASFVREITLPALLDERF
ncbi:SDR family oxidoreductase [Leucobacter sp. NPDC015123]|uniref:SDR family oxidoreductase n=1 Tax=Leucobacter sp. NPDC015123 TaxID=3364129 RepID=UPI0036F4A14C